MNITTSELLAKSLNGIETEDYTKNVIRLAKDSKLVIVSAIGDDTITFCGAITDEFYLVKGGDIFIAKEEVPATSYAGKILEKAYTDYVPYRKQSVNNDRKKINVFWEERAYFTWKFITTIPHNMFDIKKNGKNFCKGIVFSLNDI